MKQPPVLMFDLGGVLVENVTVAALNALLPEPLDDEALRRRWLASDSVRAFELGRIDPYAFASRFVLEWAPRLSPSEFLAEFTTWPRAFFDGAEDLLAALRVDHHVSCLSNCNELHWARFGGFADYFDSAFSSHLLGCIKPDAEIFAVVLRELEVDPDHLLFFDDSPLNVEAARRFDIKAFLVQGFDDTQRALTQEGLL